jgi:hypothetical protein
MIGKHRWVMAEQPTEDKELEHPQEPEDGECDGQQERCRLAMTEVVSDADLVCHSSGENR